MFKDMQLKGRKRNRHGKFSGYTHFIVTKNWKENLFLTFTTLPISLLSPTILKTDYTNRYSLILCISCPRLSYINEAEEAATDCLGCKQVQFESNSCRI